MKVDNKTGKTLRVKKPKPRYLRVVKGDKA
jgi:hypothetical protein